MTKIINQIYTNTNNERRKSGIFAPGIDRFLLIDDKDFWITLETAEILSSKLPTIVYLLPPVDFELTSDICLNYTIYNKTNQKVGTSHITVGRQHPTLKILYNIDKLVNVGIPEDYKDADRYQWLENIHSYAEFVHQHTYAANISKRFYNYLSSDEFVDKYISQDWLTEISGMKQYESKYQNIFFELRNALYLSNNQQEAEKKIIDIWKNVPTDRSYLVTGYYNILNQPLPDELSFHANSSVSTLSTYIF